MFRLFDNMSKNYGLKDASIFTSFYYRCWFEIHLRHFPTHDFWYPSQMLHGTGLFTFTYTIDLVF